MLILKVGIGTIGTIWGTSLLSVEETPREEALLEQVEQFDVMYPGWLYLHQEICALGGCHDRIPSLRRRRRLERIEETFRVLAELSELLESGRFELGNWFCEFFFPAFSLSVTLGLAKYLHT